MSHPGAPFIQFLNKRKYTATIAYMLGREFKEIEGY